jgi:carbonic anhydrase
VSLLVVLGHTGCGAVEAAASGSCGGHLAAIVDSICTIARAHPDSSLDQLVDLNVAQSLQAIADHGGPTGRATRSGAVELRGAVHDLSTGALRTLPTHLQPTPTRIPMEAS